jgi:leader peptidase (prepilin peptidase)/N-methyltransferase
VYATSLVMYVFWFITGATIGSFLNVVIYRLPLGRSVVRPRSSCPSCGRLIAWYDNIPLFSFLWLKRRCRHCGAGISARYPLVELLTAMLALGLWWRFGRFDMYMEFAVHFCFTAALVAISFIDIDHRIIPNQISLPGRAVGFGCSFLWPGMWVESLIGMLAGGGILLTISVVYTLIRGREGMGMGDVKLLAMLGAWLGWKCLPFVFLFASVQGLVAAIVLWVAGVGLKPTQPEAQDQVEDRQAAPSFMGAAIPFGPFLAMGAIEYLFLGEWFTAFLGSPGPGP